jgi:hypothetical protein
LTSALVSSEPLLDRRTALRQSSLPKTSNASFKTQSLTCTPRSGLGRSHSARLCGRWAARPSQSLPSLSFTFSCPFPPQVFVHCAERGELLDRVRRWYELELNRLNEMLERSRERIRKLQEMARKGDPLTMAELDSNIAKSSQVLYTLLVPHRTFLSPQESSA